MRLATAASIALLAFSSAALAQMARPGTPQSVQNTVSNDMAVGNTADNTAAPMATDMADNMMDGSASPPPTEPK